MEQVQSYMFGLLQVWVDLCRLKVTAKEQGDKLALFVGTSMAIQTAQHYYNSILHMSDLI